MKRITSLIICLLVAMGTFAAGNNSFANGKVNIEQVHPLYWWSGLNTKSLQVLIHGNGIGSYSVDLKDAKDIKIESTAKVESNNYLIIYLNISNAPVQKFSILLKEGGKTVKAIPYELKARTSKRLGNFDASDVLYLLMPDRFAQGVTGTAKQKMMAGMKENALSDEDLGRHGGDIQGIIDHLDYLQELGITAIWPTPTLVNDMDKESYHGYAITNYYENDPRFGTNEDYKRMVDEAHKRGIKVIQDLVFNHCGSNNFLFADMPQDNWFHYGKKFVPTTYKTGAPGDIHASEYDKNLTEKGWFVAAMPDLNESNPLVADYLLQASEWWVEYAGIDGVRQDTYPYNDFDFMKRWCNTMDKQYPGFNIVGETWVNNNVGVSLWQAGSKLNNKNSELKTVMDFPLMTLLNQVVDEETDSWDWGFAKLYAYLSQDIVYPDPLHLLTFLANHDTNRFQPTEEKAQNITRYKQALTLLLTLRGIPQLYYGDEIGMYANKGVNDGALRQNMGLMDGTKTDMTKAAKDKWPNIWTKEGRNDLQNEYFEFTKKMLNLRKGNKVLAYGDFTHYSITNGVYVYSREYNGQRVTVMMNGTSKEQTLDLEPYSKVLPTDDNNQITLGKSYTFKPRDIVILEF